MEITLELNMCTIPEWGGVNFFFHSFQVPVVELNVFKSIIQKNLLQVSKHII